MLFEVLKSDWSSNWVFTVCAEFFHSMGNPTRSAMYAVCEKRDPSNYRRLPCQVLLSTDEERCTVAAVCGVPRVRVVDKKVEAMGPPADST